MKKDIDVVYRTNPPDEKHEIPLARTDIKAEPIVKNGGIKSRLFWILQGNENELTNMINTFFTSESPEIIFHTTWVVGITFYLLFVYK